MSNIFLKYEILDIHKSKKNKSCEMSECVAHLLHVQRAMRVSMVVQNVAIS